MNIVVCAKQVVDVGEIKINPSTNKPVLEGIPRKISDIDKNAVEEAIRIKEKHGGKITVVSIGPQDAKEKIKELLAMGADEGILIPPPENMDYYMTSKILAKAVEKVGDVDIVLCGEASIDQFSGQIGPRIAGILDWPQITYAFQLESEDGKVKAQRNMGDRMVVTESDYPVVITVTKEINETRLPSLMEILGSANKPLNDWSLEDLGLEDLNPKVETVELKGVKTERKNVILDDELDEAVKKLADNLAKEGVLG